MKKIIGIMTIFVLLILGGMTEGATASTVSTNPVYRLYNQNTGEHFYTINLAEKTHLQSLGWKDEGVGWQSATAGTPVYRLYNPNAKGGDHYYTLSKYEATSLVKSGWRWDNDGKAVFYSAGTVNLYVSFNPNAKSGAHNYTTSTFEQSSLLKTGWKYGAVAWKTMASIPLPALPAGWSIDKAMNIASYTTETYAYRQCTWWVYNRGKEFGISYGLYMGNGKDWQNQTGYKVTTTPQLHSAVSFKAGQFGADATYGHVAFVEQIHSDGSILVSQSGTGYSTLFNYQVFTKSQAAKLHYVIGK